MPRQTRAARRAQQQELEEDYCATAPAPEPTDALLEDDAAPKEAREPLTETTGNVSAEEAVVAEEDVSAAPKRGAKGKKAKAGKKGRGKKQEVEEVVVEVPDEEEMAVEPKSIVMEPAVKMTEKPAEAYTSTTVPEDENKTEEEPEIVEAAAEPPRATRSRATRSQKAAPEQEQPQENADALAALEGKTPAPSTRSTRATRRGRAAATEEASEVPEAPEATVPAPAVEESAPPRLLLPAIELTEAPDDPSPVSASSASPMSPPKRVVYAEDSIEAIDALEDALEHIGRALPDLESSPEKPRRRTPRSSPTKSVGSRGSSTSRPTSQVSSEGGESMTVVEGEKKTTSPAKPKSALKSPTEEGAPRPKKRAQISTEEPSVAPPPTISPARAVARPRPVSASIAATTRPATKPSSAVPSTLQRSSSLKTRPVTAPSRPPDYLAARRNARPVSVNFPTPPAPVRSTKPVTKSTFSLPGEAVAARLKAQREAREERMRAKAEADAEAKAKAAAEAQRKRRSLQMQREQQQQQQPSPKKPRPISMPPATGNGALQVTKHTANASVKRSVSATTSSAGVPTLTRKPSTTLSKPGPVTKSTITATDLAAQRQRAKALAARDRADQKALEEERRSREEAARRARAEAAERGRIASREWAEKMMKKVGVKKDAGKENATSVGAVGRT
jgi:hypothetical protein